MRSRLTRLVAPFARALFAISVAVSTSGCATLITGIACAAGGGCGQGTIAQAVQLDVAVGAAIVEGASSSRRGSSSGDESAPLAASFEAPDVIAARDVHVDFDDGDRHSVSLFQGDPAGVGQRGKRIAACETPCRLTLAPDVYGIAVDGSITRPLTIEALTSRGPTAPVEFAFRSHEPRRIQGWTMIGGAVSGFAVLAVTSLPITETFDEGLASAHLAGTSLGLFSLLIAGVILAIWPDDLDVQVSW